MYTGATRRSEKHSPLVCPKAEPEFMAGIHEARPGAAQPRLDVVRRRTAELNTKTFWVRASAFPEPLQQSFLVSQQYSTRHPKSSPQSSKQQPCAIRARVAYCNPRSQMQRKGAQP